MNAVRLKPEIEERGKDKYVTPVNDVRKYVARALKELGLDNDLVDDSDSAMLAWRLSHQPENVQVAQEVLNMPGASLSELARAMANADQETRARIENDDRYYIEPPHHYIA